MHLTDTTRCTVLIICLSRYPLRLNIYKNKYVVRIYVLVLNFSLRVRNNRRVAISVSDKKGEYPLGQVKN